MVQSSPAREERGSCSGVVGAGPSPAPCGGGSGGGKCLLELIDFTARDPTVFDSLSMGYPPPPSGTIEASTLAASIHICQLWTGQPPEVRHQRLPHVPR
jgi:hypothetical protein